MQANVQIAGRELRGTVVRYHFRLQVRTGGPSRVMTIAVDVAAGGDPKTALALAMAKMTATLQHEAIRQRAGNDVACISTYFSRYFH